MSWAPSTCGMSPPRTWSASCAASTSCSTGWPRSSASALSLAPGRSSSGSSSSWQPSECPLGQWMCGDDGVQKGNGTCGNSGGVLPALWPPFLPPPPFPAHAVAQSPFSLSLGPPEPRPPHPPTLQGSTGAMAVSSEGVWVLCSQPQGAEESQLLLCGHVWPQQLRHQPPGPHLGGRCPGGHSAKARPLPF